MRAPVEKYFIVKKWQGGGARMAEKDVLLGYAQDEAGMIPFTVPDIPPADEYWVEPWDGKWESTYPRKVRMSATPVEGWLRTHVFNHGLPREKQRWVRPETPECWSREFIAERSKQFQKYKANKWQDDPDHWRDPDKITQDQYDYAILEWHRRIYGIWIYINGVMTWISGFHYFYIQHFKIDKGFPAYRDRDRRWFYAWQHCYDDPRCKGMVYLKHRRDGATYRCACIGLEVATRGDMEGKHFSITSKSDDDAKELFQDKVAVPFDELVPFFQPMIATGGSATSGMLKFDAQRSSATDRYDRRPGLKAWIRPSAPVKGKNARQDGSKVHFKLDDETGKREKENIDQMLRLTLESLVDAGRDGKMLLPTTHEEMTGDNAERFQRIYERSLISLKAKSALKKTPTGLISYFTPAYDGMSAAWIGPYGESIVSSPTDEQKAFLAEQEILKEEYGDEWDKGWGAYEWWMTKLSEEEDQIGFLHLYPGTPEDAFRKTNPNTDFNTLMVAKAKRDAKEIQGNGKTLLENLTIRGNLHFVGGDVKADVYFKEDPNGRFLVNKEYLPVYVGEDGVPVVGRGPGWGGETAMKLKILANRVKRKPPRQGTGEFCGAISPDLSQSRVVIGGDPNKMNQADTDKGKARRRSSAAMHGFIPYDPTVDGYYDPQMKADNPEFARDFISNAWVFEYICKPKDNDQYTYDVLMAAIFWSATVCIERQVNNTIETARRLGFITSNGSDRRGDIKRGIHGQYCDGFFIVDPKLIPGWHSDQQLINIYYNFLLDWVEYFCYIRKCPFIQTMDTWLDSDPGDMEKYDAAVSSGFCGLGAYGKDGFQTRQISNLPRSKPAPEKARNYADLHQSWFGRR